MKDDQNGDATIFAEAASIRELCGRTKDARYGSGANHGAALNARERFKIAVVKFGFGTKNKHPCVNWIKGVRVKTDGSTKFKAGPFSAGRSLTLRAEQDLIAILANCPQVLDRRAGYTATPVRVSAWRGK